VFDPALVRRHVMRHEPELHAGRRAAAVTVTAA
jgi:hypothetical protein